MLPYSFICNSVQVCVWLVRNSGHRMGLALGSWSPPMPSFWKELLEVASVIKQDVLKYIKPVTFDSSSLWSGAICFSSWNKTKYLQTCCYYLKSGLFSEHETERGPKYHSQHFPLSRIKSFCAHNELRYFNSWFVPFRPLLS